MPDNFSQVLAHASGGRRFCFVIMSFHDGYSFFRDIRRIVAEETGFECLRADDISAPGESVRHKVHAAIENAVFLLADITDPRPNIFYEIGYAIARNKPVFLLIRKGNVPPTDLHGIELIQYLDNKDGWPAFEKELRQHLGVHKDSSVSMVRAMLVPPEPQPSYLILNPKRPRKASVFHRHPRERRTYGDYLGLIGVLNTFASAFGEHCAPEIVSASHTDPEIVNSDANLFLIGSPKVNPFTKALLHEMQGDKSPGWQLGPAPGEKMEGDYEVQLTGRPGGGVFATPVGAARSVTEREDYGLIVRGPHPRYPRRMVTIMAGPHSLGTGAACLAATKAQLVSKVGKALEGKMDLSTRDRSFWVLVKAEASPDDHIDDALVSIVDAGVYH